MKMKNFNLNKRLKLWEIESGNLLYNLASDLLNQIEDEDVLLLYEDNKEIFAKLSSSSKEEILKNQDLLGKAIDILVEYLQNKQPITEEQLNNMTAHEIFNYIEHLLDTKDVTLLDIIRYLESK